MWPVAGAVVVVAALVGVALAFRPTSDGAAADAPDVISRLGDVERTDQAVGIACNLLDLAGFDQAPLPAGFYGGDSTNTAVLAPAIGVDGSGALQLGSDGAFGLFGEIVPIGQLMTADEAQEFVFSAWLKLVDRPTQTGIYIDYLDADYQQLTFERDLLGATTIVGSADGTRVTVIAEAPIGAAYAVPTVFKDGSKGSMVVDEAVFAPAPCGRPA